MIGETHFQRYIPDPHPEELVPPEDVRRHIFCSGKTYWHPPIFSYNSLTLYAGQVYYTLLKHREEQGIKDVVISRLEQISPFPYDLITPHMDKYPNAEIIWCQVRLL
jgi:2-oxoglutarate dehydrogenase E1 component